MHTSDKYIRFRLCNDKRPTKERIKKYTLVVGALSTYVFHKAGEKKSENLFLSLTHSLSCLSVKHLTKHINVFLHVNLTGDLVNYVSSSSFLSTRLPAPIFSYSQPVFALFDSSVLSFLFHFSYSYRPFSIRHNAINPFQTVFVYPFR